MKRIKVHLHIWKKLFNLIKKAKTRKDNFEKKDHAFFLDI